MYRTWQPILLCKDKPDDISKLAMQLIWNRRSRLLSIHRVGLWTGYIAVDMDRLTNCFYAYSCRYISLNSRSTKWTLIVPPSSIVAIWTKLCMRLFFPHLETKTSNENAWPAIWLFLVCIRIATAIPIVHAHIAARNYVQEKAIVGVLQTF